jgi:hypothetical protein
MIDGVWTGQQFDLRRQHDGFKTRDSMPSQAKIPIGNAGTDVGRHKE